MNNKIEPASVGTLKRDEVSGPEMPDDAPRALLRIQEYEQAKAALERVDVQELFALYEKAIRDRNSMAQALGSIVTHYVGSKDEPRGYVGHDAISAMETVALAAVDLARLVAISRSAEPQPKEPNEHT